MEANLMDVVRGKKEESEAKKKSWPSLPNWPQGKLSIMQLRQATPMMRKRDFFPIIFFSFSRIIHGDSASRKPLVLLTWVSFALRTLSSVCVSEIVLWTDSLFEIN